MTNLEIIDVVSRAEYVDGECWNVECRDKCGDDGVWHIVDYPVWNFDNFDYRIKPEPKRVPLTMQDLIDRELSGKTVSLFYDDTVLHILKYNSQYVVLINGFNFDYEYLKNNYTFLDNTPCYKEVGDVA